MDDWKGEFWMIEMMLLLLLLLLILIPLNSLILTCDITVEFSNSVLLRFELGFCVGVVVVGSG